MNILHTLEWIVTQPWFGPFVLGPLSAWAVHILFRHNRRFQKEILKLMLLVQKQYPEWDGEKKREAVVRWIQQSNKYASLIPAPIIRSIIDSVIDELKGEEQSGI